VRRALGSPIALRARAVAHTEIDLIEDELSEGRPRPGCEAKKAVDQAGRGGKTSDDRNTSSDKIGGSNRRDR
jgi:hypothetical protein